MIKVVVGLSGGVDSSVSALLLKEQGYDVLGLFMKNWDEDEHCPAAIDLEDVAAVCNAINIPFYTVNFTQEYKTQVFAEFLSESLAGRTPNPDILCNREIKFKAFYNKAKELGADYLATGHYCQLSHNPTQLLRGADPTKDQSYFLAAVQAPALQNVLFPIGHLPKSKVREIATSAKLPVANKKDSTGICFIGKRDFKEFLSQHLKATPGPMLTPEGRSLGTHDGLPFYTIGQRKGLNIGGPGDAWFVTSKDPLTNTLYVAQGENHPALFSQELTAVNPIWVSGTFTEALPYICTAKIRYRQPDQACEILSLALDRVYVRFKEPQRAVTPGQAIVFYQGDVCLGSATISF